MENLPALVVPCGLFGTPLLISLSNTVVFTSASLSLVMISKTQHNLDQKAKYLQESDIHLQQKYISRVYSFYIKDIQSVI